MGNQNFWRMLAACVAVLLGTAAQAQQVLTSESKTWSVTMPAGWQPMGKDQLEKVKATYKERAPETPARVVAGFCKAGSALGYPQVVLQVLDADTSQVSFGALNSAFDNGDSDEVSAQIAEMCFSAGCHEYSVDRNRRCVSGTGQTVVLGPGECNVASRAALWGGGVVQLVSIDLATNRAGAQTTLDQWANTVKFEAGREFQAAADPQPRRARTSSGGYGLYGGGGTAFIVLIAIVRIALRVWVRSNN